MVELCYGSIAMKKLNVLKRHLRPGRVYRRDDLIKWSTSVDRHLQELVETGTLKKLAQGLYHYPRKTVFGDAPPEEDELLKSFLKDDRFLVTTPNAYNKLGVGTTQLYNKRVVYNHKRHGEFQLGGRKFDFVQKYNFPKKVSPEFLVVDLVNSLDKLAEDKNAVLESVFEKLKSMDVSKLKKSVTEYGNTRTQKILLPKLQNLESDVYAY